MRAGIRIGPLWLSERIPPLHWPPSWRTILLLALMVALAYYLR